MVRPKTALILAALVLVNSCSDSGSPDNPAGPPTTMAASEQGDTSFVGDGNRVSEVPWWQQDAVELSAFKPAPEPTPIDSTFVLSSGVLFRVDSAELGVAASSQLNHLVGLAEQHPEAHLEIIGHTDSTPGPTPSYNEELSLERAESVQAWLIGAGVDPRRISVDGRGADEPVTSNETEAGRAANRRVTITVSETDG